ncbi:MAG: 2-C-methyl-D-erythritol 2,4-cyclodiphosphate synthase [Lentimicrobium sp.]|nr:2-C-methyl-D-erythritol 2,4-cyclodiphosphate synthase [Lentimicrobium sp.]MEA5112096.1 2-C-methyl-D-erythritol 2,4-cyclodiphosphate synthase [Lentimicrobium sp.]
MFQFRIGMGYDVHQLADGLPFVLGGVRIDHPKGAVGHSDADVLLHAICDALLGAAGLRDIGYHFPDSSDQYKGIDSRILLSHTIRLLNENEWQTGNIDCTIALQRPKIAGYIQKMQEEIEAITGSGPGSVSVKATTTEHLGFTGREEGVAAWAVALIYKSGSDHFNH